MAPVEAPGESKVGIARAAREAVIHGLRQPPEDGTTGWFIWRGEYSDAEDFFAPLHVIHLREHLPQVLPYLALPPGWRILLAPGHADVWHDAELLDI